MGYHRCKSDNVKTRWRRSFTLAQLLKILDQVQSRWPWPRGQSTFSENLVKVITREPGAVGFWNWYHRYAYLAGWGHWQSSSNFQGRWPAPYTQRCHPVCAKHLTVALEGWSLRTSYSGEIKSPKSAQRRNWCTSEASWNVRFYGNTAGGGSEVSS